MKYEKSKAFAHTLDSDDRLAKYRDEFLYPKNNCKYVKGCKILA